MSEICPYLQAEKWKKCGVLQALMHSVINGLGGFFLGSLNGYAAYFGESAAVFGYLIRSAAHLKKRNLETKLLHDKERKILDIY